MHSLKKGLYTALITPFVEEKVDYKSLGKLLDFQINAGVKSVVLCGTTGEAPTLNEEEKLEIAKFAVKHCNGKMNIILNTGSNNTKQSSELTQKASTIGINGIMAVTPYYNKASDEGLYLHFKSIANSTELPVILYNVPSRTGLNIKDDLIAKLYKEIQNIVGLKDATGDLTRVISIRSKTDDNFLLLSGEDETALGFNVSGGDGCISVVSNIAPKLALELQNLSLSRNNLDKVLEKQQKNSQIAKVLFSEVNPIPVKHLAYLMGLCEAEYRLPLCVPSAKTIEELKNILHLCQ
jgi:4-hydroxy-tetrahydrodipicolinate synthase